MVPGAPGIDGRPSTHDPRAYETLNGIRGVAAICVVIFHTCSSFWPQQMISGGLAVDIFFVLSGFVLAGAYGTKLDTGRLAPSDFTTIRILRFYPLYVAGALVGLAAIIAERLTGSPNAYAGSLPVAVAYMLFFIPASGLGTTIAPLDGPAWSLIFELWVNIGWATSSRRLDTKAYLILTGFAGCAFTIFAVRNGGTNLGTYFDELVAGLARTIFSFGAGIIIYRVNHRAARIETPVSLAALIVVALALQMSPPAWAVLPYMLLMILVGSPLIIFLASTIEPTPALRSSFAFLGDISFPIYILHYPLIAMWIFLGRTFQTAPAVTGLLFLSSLLAVSWAAHCTDRKAQAWLRRLVQPRVTSPTLQL